MSMKYTLNTIIDQWIHPHIDIITLTLHLQFKPDFNTEEGLSLDHYEHALIGNALATRGLTLKVSKEKLYWLSNYREWKVFYREDPLTRKNLERKINLLVDMGILEKSSIIFCNNKECEDQGTKFTEEVDRCPKCGYSVVIKELIPPRFKINPEAVKNIEKMITGCVEKYKVINGSEDYLRQVQRRDKEKDISYSEVLERFEQIEHYLRLKEIKDNEKSIQK